MRLRIIQRDSREKSAGIGRPEALFSNTTYFSRALIVEINHQHLQLCFNFIGKNICRFQGKTFIPVTLEDEM